jgi:hypothetical protein
MCLINLHVQSIFASMKIIHIYSVFLVFISAFASAQDTKIRTPKLSGITNNNQPSPTKDAADLNKELTKLFKPPSTNEFILENGGIDQAENTYQQFVKLCSDLLANGGKARVASAKLVNRYRYPQGLSEELSGFDIRAKGIKKDFDKSIEEKWSLRNYYLAKKYVVYWETAMALMPEDPAFKQNFEIATQLVSEMGTLEDVKSKSKASLNNRLSSVKIPDAVRKDLNTENIFKKAFIAEGWNETISVIHLRDSDWKIVKHPNTGVILGRSQTASIATKNQSGECILYLFTIIQDYTGSGYQSNARRSSHNAVPMSCENMH